MREKYNYMITFQPKENLTVESLQNIQELIQNWLVDFIKLNDYCYISLNSKSENDMTELSEKLRKITNGYKLPSHSVYFPNTNEKTYTIEYFTILPIKEVIYSIYKGFMLTENANKINHFNEKNNSTIRI